MGFAQCLAAALSEVFDCLVFFRDDQKLSEAYEEIVKFEPDLNIELHFNSSESDLAVGTEVLFSKYSAGPVAEWLQKALCTALNRTGPSDRGVKFLSPGSRGYSNTQYLNCPNVLIEPFFGSNAQDCELGRKNMDRMAAEIRNNLMLYFGVGAAEELD